MADPRGGWAMSQAINVISWISAAGYAVITLLTVVAWVRRPC